MSNLATRPAPRVEPRHRRPSEPPLGELARTRRVLPLLALLMVILPVAALATPRAHAAPSPRESVVVVDAQVGGTPSR